jgi:beta-aspartyl-peptidase (threonine type)
MKINEQMIHKILNIFLIELLCHFFAYAQMDTPPVAIVIQGGAGTLQKNDFTIALENEYKSVLKEALYSGFKILDSGGTAVQAVIASIKILEDSPLFNAGKGAVFNHEGKNELDAAIMDGETLKAGAVAGITIVKNPIEAAYMVMTRTPHVLLSGKGADEFAKISGLTIVDSSYFYTERQYQNLIRTKEKEINEGRSNDPGGNKFGTVGAVALDQYGNIAAGTSTGGMTNKRYGRIGDSPIIGAGTYADNNTCAISATGHGEYYIRKVISYDIAARMKYLHLSLEESAEVVIMKELPAFGGSGGIIGIDRKGNITMKFNTSGMYRGYLRKGEEPRVFIFQD